MSTMHVKRFKKITFDQTPDIDIYLTDKGLIMEQQGLNGKDVITLPDFNILIETIKELTNEA